MKNPAKILITAFSVVFLIYFIAAISSAYTLLPNVDEAWFTVPGYNLVENGFFGTSTLEETANFRKVRLDGINQHTYWIMPVFPLAQGIGGKIAGFGLFQTRFVSIIFGLIALLSWALLIKKLSGGSGIALVTVGILAIDYHFIYAASLGRMDMMTVSLGVSSLAAFAWLREKNLNRAVLYSYTLTALAFFTHPLGLLWFVSLTILVFLLDFRRIKIRHFAFAALPYFALAFLWSTYILQAPDLFFLQFGGNASDRLGFFRAPISELWREIQLRYLFNFGIGDGLNRSGQIKIFVLIAYLSAIVGILIIRPLRESILARFLLLIALQEFVMLLLLDGWNQFYYLIYITPTLTAILVIWINWLWTQKKGSKILSVGVLLIVICVHSSTDFLRFRRDDYHTKYLATGKFLNQNAQPNDLIMASSEFWFVLNRKENLIDDYRLGYLTGKRADFIVMDSTRYKDWFAKLAERETATYQYMENLLQDNYELVYQDETYQVYAQKKRNKLPIVRNKKFGSLLLFQNQI